MSRLYQFLQSVLLATTVQNVRFPVHHERRAMFQELASSPPHYAPHKYRKETGSRGVSAEFSSAFILAFWAKGSHGRARPISWIRSAEVKCLQYSGGISSLTGHFRGRRSELRKAVPDDRLPTDRQDRTDMELGL